MRKVYLALIAGSIIGLASGCTTHAQPTDRTAYANPRAPHATTASKRVVTAITPIRRFKPRYPGEAVARGLQGCVRVTFHVDTHGRPTRLQTAASLPRGIFDRAAISAMAKWRFRATAINAKGEAIPPPPSGTVSQTLTFELSPAGETTANRLDWICGQGYARTLIVTQAAATAAQPLRIVPDDKKRVDRIFLAVPRGTALPNGWVNVAFCVSTDGKAVHSKVTGSAPRGLYDKAAVTALKTWPFRARKVLGHKVGTCGLQEHIPVFGADFLAKSPAVLNQRPTALQSADLWPKGTRVPASGKVTLTFCVEADGSVDHVKVTQAKPSAVFDEAARKVLTVWQYWPRMINGKPVATCNIQSSIQFRRTHQRLLWAESAS